MKILSLFINIWFQNLNLIEGTKLEIEKFVSQLFLIRNEENMIIDPNTKITTVSWIYAYIEKTSVDLISKIYFSISTILLITQYLASYAILAIANFDVIQLNNFTLEMMKGEWQLFKSVDKAADLANRKSFSLKFFYQIYKPSLPPYILQLIIGMPVILLYNLNPSKLCNGIKIQLRFIGRKVLEKVIMVKKYKGQKALLLYIPLQSKITMSAHQFYLYVANFQSDVFLL